MTKNRPAGIPRIKKESLQEHFRVGVLYLVLYLAKSSDAVIASCSAV